MILAGLVWFDQMMIPATLEGLRAEVAFSDDITDHNIREQLEHFERRGAVDVDWTLIMTKAVNQRTGKHQKARVRSYKLTQQGKILARASGVKVHAV